MNVSFVEIGDVIVAGLRHGEAKALNQQKSSSSIKNIIVAEQMVKDATFLYEAPKLG